MTEEIEALESILGDTMEKAYDEAIKPEPENKTESTENTEIPETAEGEEVTEAVEGDETADKGSEKVDNPAEKQPVTPPERWSAEDKASFLKLPREAQEIVLAREQERDKAFTQKTQEIAEFKRNSEALERVIAPRRPLLAASGMTAEQELSQLYQLSDYAAKDPVGFISHFAKQRGIDLANLTTGQEIDNFVDPAVAAIQQTVRNLEQKLSLQEQERLVQVQSEAQALIDAFKSDPKHIYFEEVRADMQALLKGGAAKDLEDAYEKAIYANPLVRTKVLDEQRKVEEEKRRKESAEAAAKAKKAAGTQVKSKADSSAAKVKRTMEETMNEAYDRAMGAA